MVRKTSLVVMFLAAACGCLSGCSTLKSTYTRNVGLQICKQPQSSDELLAMKDVEGLPFAVQRHLGYCCFIGKPKVHSAEIEWEDVHIKRSGKGQLRWVSYFQYNGVQPPVRITYMKDFLAGTFPLEAMSGFYDEQGSVKARLAYFLNIRNRQNMEVTRSALGLILAEALLVPGYATQPYIRWEAVDNCTARATISYAGVHASGTYYFDDRGALSRFELDNDQDGLHCDNCAGVSSVEMRSYMDLSNAGNSSDVCIKYPRSVRFNWHFTNGDHLYFEGTIKKIRFNVKDIERPAKPLLNTDPRGEL